MRSDPQPLGGRRFWIAGIGGAGMSGYALVAHDWGASVAGWDRAETPYLAPLRERRIEIAISPDPPPPPRDCEPVVSTAFAGRVAGHPRAWLLAQLVDLRRAIVVSGAHGKTTTAAMIAFALDRLDLDPAFLIGGVVPQLGGNARAGSGWLVVEGDESDRTIESLRAEIAVVTNVDLDHHSTFASLAEVHALYDGWLEGVRAVVRGDELEPINAELAVPGEHNRRNAAAALAALDAAGVARAEATAALKEFRGVERRLELRGEAGGVRVIDDYAHHPAEIAATIAAIRETSRDARVLVLFQPHLYSRTRHLARELAGALASADVVAVAEVYPAREEPVTGVDGKLIVDALAERANGVTVAWTPDVETGARFLVRRARSGDVLATVGAGDVDRVVPMVLGELR